jgi:hypothetical protein
MYSASHIYMRKTMLWAALAAGCMGDVGSGTDIGSEYTWRLNGTSLNTAQARPATDPQSPRLIWFESLQSATIDGSPATVILNLGQLKFLSGGFYWPIPAGRRTQFTASLIDGVLGVVTVDSKSGGAYYVVDATTGDPICSGGAPALALSGDWDYTRGGHDTSNPDAFTFACATDALAKCVTWGYDLGTYPDLHQACTRMVRADYDGDGTAHTSDGVAIDVFDAYNIQTPELSSGTDEAMWSPYGAVCLSNTRPGASSPLGVIPKCASFPNWGLAPLADRF